MKYSLFVNNEIGVGEAAIALANSIASYFPEAVGERFNAVVSAIATVLNSFTGGFSLTDIPAIASSLMAAVAEFIPAAIGLDFFTTILTNSISLL